MITRSLVVALRAALLDSLTPAQAGLILSFSPSTPAVTAVGNQGSVTIDVRAAADSGTQTLRGYDLFVDLAPAGKALPAGWSVTTPTALTTFDFFAPSTNPSQGDVAASAANTSSAAISLTTTPTPLWRFTVNMNGNTGAVNGAYNMTFLTGGNFSVVDASSGNISPVAVNNGTITLQGFDAVPEPSTFALIAIAAVGALVGVSWSKIGCARRGSGDQS